MGVYETGVRGAWRGLMRVAEARIARADELGRAMPGAGTDAPPVLLVHGYGNTSAAWDAIERSLRRDGFRVSTVDLPQHGFGDAQGDARVVGEAVAAIRAGTGSPVVDVVGHSRGGLVARMWAQLLDSDEQAGRVVTLSSANGGLHLGPLDGIAAGALPQGMQQIRRGSQLIESLRRTAGGHDLVAVGTNGIDGVLVPAHAARIDGAPFLSVDDGRRIGPLSRLGHYGVLRDDRTYETLRAALLAGGRSG